VEIETYRCEACGEEFEDPEGSNDTMEEVYRAYRTKKKMVSPEEIRNFRKQHALTQDEFSRLLGMGVTTLNRYENGALQTEAHDRILKLAMETGNLLKLAQIHPEAIQSEKLKGLLARLENKEEENIFLSIEQYVERLADYPADIYSGYRRFDLGKFLGMIKFFCYADAVFTTKLTKLLFYADFCHFRENTVSITGSRYAHLPHGPVPDQYDTWFWFLTLKEPGLRKEEVVFPNYAGEAFISEEPPDLGLFGPAEFDTLVTVRERFKSFTARQMREHSHREKGYEETENGELISFKFAEGLSMPGEG
jgi:putative zinc finger/helix-turn-helix YgiT family protein